MQKLKLKDTVYTIPMPTDNTYKVINCRKTTISKELFIITGISESELNKIKNNQELKLKRGDFEFNISPDNIFCYGEIDFHENSEDCDVIDTFNWLDDKYIKGVPVPSKYDYDKHECISNRKFVTWTETFKNSTLCRYFHGCLGKPRFTLIFREVK